MKKLLLLFVMALGLLSCKNDSKVETKNEKEDVIIVESFQQEMETITEQSTAEIKANLTSKGYQIFDYVNEKTRDTVLMQQYFIAFLKRGPIRNQNEEEATRLQKEHMAHLDKMYDLGYADISDLLEMMETLGVSQFTMCQL